MAVLKRNLNTDDSENPTASKRPRADLEPSSQQEAPEPELQNPPAASPQEDAQEPCSLRPGCPRPGLTINTSFDWDNLPESSITSDVSLGAWACKAACESGLIGPEPSGFSLQQWLPEPADDVEDGDTASSPDNDPSESTEAPGDSWGPELHGCGTGGVQDNVTVSLGPLAWGAGLGVTCLPVFGQAPSAECDLLTC